ncbi:ribonuclease G [Candidatus Contendibacter odensensis]|uniref:Ribonuclease G n=1 Tax=Candidatus Contendobacter odensis Run_B_J11 TaxID=1400861 RepID=A0A7U7GAQ9_9GAMM|nr:ribonuclease G [Candidatus Contendobacter odensis]CDH44886.1 RNase G (ribonuclease G) [Candidatus Contendobacter odensis Run_B_J11]
MATRTEGGTGDEILINVTPRETRVAVVENGVLQEILIERAGKRGLVGNIYKGRACRVLPGMEAAFVDIGLERAAFLHVSDIRPESLPESGASATHSDRAALAITDLVREGQELVVQVIKDPIGTKGARLTTHITLPSRFLVFLADSDVAGVSVKIDGERERQRLKEVVNAFRAEFGGGYIVRTAAEGAESEALQADMQFLQRLWSSIRERIKETSGILTLYEDLPLVLRVLRDFIGDNVEKVRIDSRETCQRMLEFADKFVPEMGPRLEHYPGERPIFELYGIEDELQKALGKKVPLKSGGYLIVDQTEAMATIDVNTGAYVGHRNLEETIFKTNLEAAAAIARQLRLRNLGGIIILDFIDMVSEEHRQAVLKALEKHLEKDRAKSHISQVSPLGLVEMTRKRTRESLEQILCEPCPLCDGRGSIKTAETVCYEIFRELLRETRQYSPRQFVVLAAPDVVDAMQDQESTSVAQLEAFIGIPIKFQAEALYTREQYDVVLM